MRFNIVAKILGLIVGVVSLFMLWPLAWAYLDNSSEVGPIFSSMIIGIAISVILLFAGSNSTSTDMRPREALAIVGLSWLSVSAIGALPFWLSGDFFIAFSTAHTIPHETDKLTLQGTTVTNEALSPLFLATVEAVEEAAINSILKATTVVGRDGNIKEGIDVEDLIQVLRKYNTVNLHDKTEGDS